jgi:hypothetical protein
MYWSLMSWSVVSGRPTVWYSFLNVEAASVGSVFN